MSAPCSPVPNSRSTRGASTHGRRVLAIVAAVAIGLVCAACQTSGGPNLRRIATEVNATLEPATVVLGVGDQIEVRFASSPTWNQVVDITSDGGASFLAIGRLIVAGMSPGRLNQTLTDAYSRVLTNPELDVSVKSLGARTVYVMGEVLNPGEFALGPDRRLTLVEALARAGGPIKASAYLAHTMLVRWSASTGKQLHWTIDARPEYWTGKVPLYLQPYDVIYVPNTPVDVVAIWIDNYIRRMIPLPYLFSPRGV
jgi:protein involved in polysaccharide export with SLBB domain